MTYNSHAHAKHNWDVCGYLNDHGDFDDWVVTTAFYSSLHYARHALFPKKYVCNGVEKFYNNFNEYLLDSNSDKPHKVLSNLIGLYLVEIAHKYRELSNICHGARYTDYNISEDSKKKAIDHLSDISKYCSTQQAK